MTVMDAGNSEVLQQQLYYMIDKLQDMARELPPSIQMRVPLELLSSLANCLVQCHQIFDIVMEMMEIQQVTEKHLFQQRLTVSNQHKLDIQELIHRNLPELVLKEAVLELRKAHDEQLLNVDKTIVVKLDQKVSDQQSTLEQAGVPGFYVTTNPVEIKVQMHLLDFIIRLSKWTKSPTST